MSCGSTRGSQAALHEASSHAAIPDAIASTVDSASNRRTSRLREAPNAILTPSSRRRAAFRASMRLPTLVAAITSTSSAIAIRKTLATVAGSRISSVMPRAGRARNVKSRTAVSRCVMRDAITDNSASACARDTLGANRPVT
jgi:hypothetical protein